MLMSKSRLEKFLYALYSLDSSDLPNPLSRIEELYKCLVTGEEPPTFEPLSRVEKYLMAILGVYDVDSLPNPISRVEVLLHKLATGDDNLDDVKSFLSEHEELLAEIIRNGGVGGNIDIEYVLYTLSTEYNTLYNTAEKPVKSAILKGQTLVNFNSGQIKSDSSFSNGVVWFGQSIANVSIGEKYFVKLFNHDGYFSKALFGGNIGEHKVELIDGEYAIVNAQTTDNILHIYTDSVAITSDQVSNVRAIVCEYQEGMENWDIPYFEGMKSVENPVVTTTGKNLFDGALEPGGLDSATGLPNDSQSDRYRSVNYVKVNPNTSYIFSLNYSSTIGVREFDGKYAYLKKWYSLSSNGGYAFTTSENARFIRFLVLNTHSDNQIQLEEGSVATEYEPYKSTTVTCNEEVELRRIGDVKDELDLVTGEFIKRISELVLDGSEDWATISSEEGVNTSLYRADGIIANELAKVTWGVDHGVSLPIPYKWKTYDIDEEGVVFTQPSGHCYVRSTIRNLSDFTQWLMANPITIQYELLTESVKTVDISTVSQDGNNTKLKTFDDITYVTLSSEGLIPEAELEVATKNEEDLEDSIVYTVHTLSEKYNTLYNTVEKPVKSAILKGQTLVNLSPNKSVDYTESAVFSYTQLFEIDTIYTIIYDVIANDNNAHIMVDSIKTEFYDAEMWSYYVDSSVGHHQMTFTYTGEHGGFNWWCNPSDSRIIIDNIIILEGDYTNIGVSYFEGMTSVKMPVLTTSNEDGTKTNILTVNEEVELGSVGEVEDELDLLTGKITQRTDIRPYQEGDESDSEVLTDMTNTRYKLVQEVVKTVDLSTVDQDGNDTELSSFDDITHVTLSSEGLIPEAELEVAEKVTEVAASMLTISREQEVIDTTTNEQSENVDSTMLATTEIYEGLL